MKTKLIEGLSQVHSKYDAFFIDLWGVIHNGIQLYPGAVNVLENLNKLNKRFVLISNAPRPSKSVEKYLLNLKMDKAYLKNIFTFNSSLSNIEISFSGSYVLSCSNPSAVYVKNSNSFISVFNLMLVLDCHRQVLFHRHPALCLVLLVPRHPVPVLLDQQLVLQIDLNLM